MANKYSMAEQIEIFHLTFLSHLSKNAINDNLVVKGGVAMRVLYASPRFSNDIDLDVDDNLGVYKLGKRINTILTSDGFVDDLMKNDIGIKAITAPKQTLTTQRWKVQLDGARYLGVDIPTKLEFSRRGLAGLPTKQIVGAKYANIKEFNFRHYNVNTMFSQKVVALAKRAEPKARDVFDLNWILTHCNLKNKAVGLSPEIADLAFAQLNSLTFEDYQAQVVPFLGAKTLIEFGHKNDWLQMKNKVSQQLSEAALKTNAIAHDNIKRGIVIK